MDPFDSNNELCRVPQPPKPIPATPGPVLITPSLVVPRRVTRSGAVLIPMLSDETGYFCPEESTDPEDWVIDRFSRKDNDKAGVADHYKQMFNTKVPRTDDDVLGVVTRAYTAEMCDFELRWEPTAAAYFDTQPDHLGGSAFRYGQTHLRVFPGTFIRGDERATWPGEAAVEVPTGVFGVYLQYPAAFWPEGGSADFSGFEIVFFAENQRYPDDYVDVDLRCQEQHIAPSSGMMILKLGVVGPDVLPRPTGLELPKGILQLVNTPVLLSATASDHGFKVWDRTTAGGFAFVMTPGEVAAPGASLSARVPLWGSGGSSVAIYPLVEKTPSHDVTYLVATVEYDADEVFQEIYMEQLSEAEAAAWVDTYTKGKKVVARLEKVLDGATPSRLEITQLVSGSQNCTKCNVFYGWART